MDNEQKQSIELEKFWNSDYYKIWLNLARREYQNKKLDYINDYTNIEDFLKHHLPKIK